jgi:hypothetical protein
LIELEKKNLVHSMKAGLSQFFVAVIVDVKQEKNTIKRVRKILSMRH